MFIPSPVGGHLHCFHVLVILNQAAENMHGRVSVWPHVFVSLGQMPKVELL